MRLFFQIVAIVLSVCAAANAFVLTSGFSGKELLTIPEPASIALIGSGLLAVGTMLKRKDRNS